MTFVIADVGL